ncbi:MAG TPA: GlxA family transcriptional regulator [Usitatibacter sp.]|nr:GlxA family transcriptional regulator [Usitatibacter sp.]
MKQTVPQRLSVAFVLQPDFTLVAFSSFVDALRLAADEADRSRPLRCRWEVVSHDLRPVRASCGIEVMPTRELGDPAEFDYVVVVGGLLPAGRGFSPRLVEYLQHAARADRTLIGVCTGSFLLARAGLMRRHRSCVSWFHHRDFVLEFPDHAVTSDQLFVVDRNRITCAGGTSVVHLAAHLIERHVSKPEAQKALRIMIEKAALPSRSPQPQPSFAGDTDNVWIRRAMLLMERKVGSRFSVLGIARELHVSARHLERLFRAELGVRPSEFARTLRLRKAYDLLVDTRKPISEIALDSGFADGSHFSRRFRDAYGRSPSQVRRGVERRARGPLVASGKKPVASGKAAGGRRAQPRGVRQPS